MKRAEIAKHLHASSQVTRAEIFGAEDDAKYRPLRYPEDTATMFAGYIGPTYAEGGIVFFGINPGGGGDGPRHPDDDRLYALLRDFRDSPMSQRKFDAINAAFPAIAERWRLWLIFQPSLEAFGVSLSDVCYFNAVPYRTRDNIQPLRGPQRVAWQKLIAPALAILKPSILVALGAAVGDTIHRFNEHDAKVYVVPRTRGDRSVSDAARQVLVGIRREFGA